MPAKLTLICIIHSIVEIDINNFVVKEAIAVVRNEDNTTLNLLFFQIILQFQNGFQIFH
jgi:hypothetical protein